MKAILAVLWGDNDGETVLDLALKVAARFGSHVTALYVRPSADSFIPSGDFGLALSQDYLERLQQDGVAKSARLKSAYDNVTARHGVRNSDVPNEAGVTAEWNEAEGSAGLYIGSVGRIHDLIVVARPDLKGAAETEILLESALFETGRPILVAPPVTTAEVATKAIVAWNGSTETARALALGMPLLRLAQSVAVVSTEGAQVPGPTAADVARYLQRSGLSTTTRHIESTALAPGEAFLAEAATLGCDLMIKGAYTQSRLRQLIFGGATRHILNAATLPVLMAH